MEEENRAKKLRKKEKGKQKNKKEQQRKERQLKSGKNNVSGKKKVVAQALSDDETVLSNFMQEIQVDNYIYAWEFEKLCIWAGVQ